MRISELTGVTGGEFDVEDIFVYRMAGVDSSGKALGSFYATGYEPQCLRRMAAKGFDMNPRVFTARELKSGGDYRTDHFVR